MIATESPVPSQSDWDLEKCALTPFPWRMTASFISEGLIRSIVADGKDHSGRHAADRRVGAGNRIDRRSCGASCHQRFGAIADGFARRGSGEDARNHCRDAGDAGMAIIDRLGRDSMVSSVLLLYGLHPEDFESRVVKAVDRRSRSCGSRAVKLNCSA